jgi:molybdopterin synthase catalytic subunit
MIGRRTEIRDTALSIDEVVAKVSRPGAGGLSVFLGVVRDTSDGHPVRQLEYTAYTSMAERELERIADELEAASPELRVAAVHRLGMLEVGEFAVVCAASAPHRAEAFKACRELIDQIKARVPIWKREFGPDGASWVGWQDARCGHNHA